MIDVGFGGDGATRPVRLVEDQPQQNLGTQEIRLIKDHIPSQADRRPETKLWIYQYRNNIDKPWNSFYAFAEIEAMEADFGIMNWFTSSNPISPQLGEVLAVKFLRRPKDDGSGDQEIYGKRLLVNELVKANLGGRTEVVQHCVSENERIEALKLWFGIILTQEERDGIRGWRTELKKSSLFQEKNGAS